MLYFTCMESFKKLALSYFTCLEKFKTLNLPYFTSLEGSEKLNVSYFMCLEAQNVNKYITFARTLMRENCFLIGSEGV